MAVTKSARKPSILVVDDEIDSCRNLADILSELDYEVDTAVHGPAAIELASQRAYDIALIDLKMPGMDGVSVYRRLRQICPSMVGLIVTAYASDPTTREALGAGAWQVVSKPIDVPRLLPLVAEAINQPLVLVVDDDASLCDSLWDVLRERGLRVALAHTEKDAVAALSEAAYQVVLVDLKLPGGDGRNVLRSLREQQPESHAVLITGYASELGGDAKGAIALGADAVCFKPFDVESLLSTVDRLARSTKRSE